LVGLEFTLLERMLIISEKETVKPGDFEEKAHITRGFEFSNPKPGVQLFIPFCNTKGFK
jgi:hypothetical protein